MVRVTGFEPARSSGSRPASLPYGSHSDESVIHSSRSGSRHVAPEPATHGPADLRVVRRPTAPMALRAVRKSRDVAPEPLSYALSITLSGEWCVIGDSSENRTRTTS